MRYETHTIRIGTDVGQIDWEHAIAKDMPSIWRDAAKAPDDYLLNGRQILKVCMYDGWPYWKPTPAVLFIGPLNSGEWAFFNSYGVHASSITKKTMALAS